MGFKTGRRSLHAPNRPNDQELKDAGGRIYVNGKLTPTNITLEAFMAQRAYLDLAKSENNGSAILQT